MGIKPRVRVRVLLLALLALGALAGARPGQAAALEVGQKAPNFTLPSTTGEKISLKQFLGKKAVLVEFYGDDTAPV
jgi:hypothetical protein